MKKGFTLLELLATIAIMAVLIAAVLPFVSSYTAWAKKTQAQRSALLVADAINRYNALAGASEPVQNVIPSNAVLSTASVSAKLLGTAQTIMIDSQPSKFIAKGLSATDVQIANGVVTVHYGPSATEVKTASF